MNDGSLALFTAALPVMRVAVRLDFLQIGTVLSLGLVATMLLQLLFGYLSDRGRAGPILVLGFAGIFAVDLVFPLSSVFMQVLVCYVLLRSAAAVYHPVSFSSIGRTYVENRTTAFGYQGAVGDLGLMLATFSTGILSEMLGWKVPFWVWGIFGIVAFAYFSYTLYRRRVDFYTQPVASNDDTNKDSSTSKSLKSAFAVLTMVSSVTTTGFILFTGYMPLYFNVIGGLSPAESTAIVASWIGIGVFAGLMTGRVVEKCGGEARALRIAFAVEALLFLIGIVAFSYSWPVPWALVLGYAAIVLTGVPVFISFPAVYGLLGLRMPHKRLGLTYATSLSLGLLVASIATYSTGYLASIATIAVILPIFLVIAVVGTATSFAL
jgi:predicted MFS family arabinose efflux permease